MLKPVVALALIALSIPVSQGRARPVRLLRGVRMTLEHVAGGEAVVRLEAETEERLAHVRVLRPDGEPLVALETMGPGERGLSGVLLELRESDLATLLACYAEGPYAIQAETDAGDPLAGVARFSFDLPRAPLVAYPTDGAIGLPGAGLGVKWLADPEAVGYEIQLEQDDNDGLSVHLPPGRDSFRIPEGLVVPGVATELEVTAIGANGNRSITVVHFTTR